MAEEKIVRGILRKLTPEEQRALSEVQPGQLESVIDRLLHIPPAALSGYMKRIRKVELKTDEKYTLEEVLKVREFRDLLTRITPQYLFKLTRDDLQALLTIARRHPGLIKPIPVPIKPPVKPPVKVPPLPHVKLPTEEEIKVKISEVKERLPRRWRIFLPFKTAEFIKKFLLLRGTEGAYPYEIWKAMCNALVGIYESEEVRTMMRSVGGIPVDGIIDHELVEGIPVVEELRRIGKMKEPIYHIPLYSSFRKYFYILTKLALIKRTDKRAPPRRVRIIEELELIGIEQRVEKVYDFVKENFWRQYYIITPGKVESPMWRRPIVYYDPFSCLGKRRYRELEVSALEEERDLKDLFYKENKEWIESIAEIRGITVEEVLKM